jgi:multidrug efflux pump subunit AcrB
MGIVALAGVVVNDSLILVDATNEYQREGNDIWRATLMGGARRFRPILLTSLTTFFGLAPMILETSVQARFLIPMAISLGFGVLFATFITLLLIPAGYMVLDDATRGVGNFMHWLKGEKPDEEPEEPEGPPDALISDAGLDSHPAE